MLGLPCVVRNACTCAHTHLQERTLSAVAAALPALQTEACLACLAPLRVRGATSVSILNVASLEVIAAGAHEA